MIVLVDSDIVAYRCAAAAEKFALSVAIDWTNNLMEEIINATGASEYKAYLSGPKETNFRYKVDPLYKANRADIVKPIHLMACKEHLVTTWKAQITDGYEADDALGMEQKGSGTIIASIDKDLLQVPGNHYNFVKKLFTTVTEDQGLKAFYTQTLVGDRSDGITGVVGLGPVKAAKVLDPLLPEEYYNACKELYNDDIRYHRNCELLWILRTHKSPGGGIHYWSKDATREESDISSREASAASQHTSVPKNTDTPSKIVPYFGMDE